MRNYKTLYSELSTNDLLSPEHAAVAVLRIRTLRAQAGPTAFDAAWTAVTGDPQPDWLREP